MKLDELKLEVDYFLFDENLYQKLKATPLKNPKLVSFNKKACDLIGLDSRVDVVRCSVCAFIEIDATGCVET